MEEIDVKTEIMNFNPTDFMWMTINGNDEQLSALIYMMYADIQLKADIDYKLEEMVNNAALHPYGYMATSKFRYIESLVEMDTNTEDRVLAIIKENENDNQRQESRLFQEILAAIKENGKDNNNELQLKKTIDPNAQKLEEAVAFEQMLFNQFADFKKHSEFLKKHGFYVLEEGHLHWIHGGNLLLAAYFGKIQDRPGNFTCIWANIEKAFNTKHLSQHFCDYKDNKKGKTDKYREYDKILSDLIGGRIPL